MFLAVDIGNTQTTVGLFDQSGIVLRQWRMATDRTDTGDELHVHLYGYFRMFELNLSDVTDAAVASVVPILSQEWQRGIRTTFNIDPLIIDASKNCGIEVAMPDPHQVGADRIANAVSAHKSYGAPVIVVDFGTATNIDVIDAHGRFRGGAITPGLLASASALFSHAAKLSSVPLIVPAHALGNTTDTAIQSGIVIGAAVQAEGLVKRISAELSAEWLAETKTVMAKPTVIGTGGLADVIAAATDIFDLIDPDLTIRGIHQIWNHFIIHRANNKDASSN
jgi:type III pantothenate kinase